MSDSEQISSAGIVKAIIVDDGYDLIPRVEEIADDDSWDTFFDDAIGDSGVKIKALYKHFDRNEREAMKADQGLIDALWEDKDKLGPIVEDLFSEYIEKSTTNSEFLDAAQTALDELGISYETHGREFIDAAKTADLILVDLYLGTKQGKAEYDVTVSALKEAVDGRDQSKPPSIILMSQAPLVNEKSKGFRSDVGLHASGFRVVRKKDILQPGHLAGLIITLATHRADSHALAGFLETWTRKSTDAVQKTSVNLRKIDIDDLQHTRSILLSVENLNAASYMLDVFDRVLRHQIEASPDVVQAASLLDAISEDPPPLTLAEHKDPLELIERIIYVNQERVKQFTGACWPITFGDIIVPKEEVSPKKHGPFSGKTDLVYFVASPECDLVREGKLKTVLLIAGTLHPLSTREKLINDPTHITPVFVGSDKKRYQIRWDFGQHISLTLKKVENWLGDDGDGYVGARLRDVTAIALRQRFLGDFGRVGEPAPRPRAFPVQVQIFYPKKGGGLTELSRADGGPINGICLVERKGGNSNLIFDQDSEPHLFAALKSIEPGTVHKSSAVKISRATDQVTFRELFRTGFYKIGFPIKANTRANLRLKGGLDDKGKQEYSLIEVGVVLKTKDIELTLGGGLENAGLIFQVTEILP